MEAMKPESGSANEDQQSPPLRREFVALMFALAVAEIGMKASDLVLARSRWDIVPGIAHLGLATLVIASSWVAWSRARPTRIGDEPNTCFQRAFAVLLMDLLIVIQYFILVRGMKWTNGELDLQTIARSEAYVHATGTNRRSMSH